VKVRIKETPRVREIDGIRLDDMRPGTIREVSPTVGAWLVAEGYGEPEMRQSSGKLPPGVGILTDRRKGPK